MQVQDYFIEKKIHLLLILCSTLKTLIFKLELYKTAV